MSLSKTRMLPNHVYTVLQSNEAWNGSVWKLVKEEKHGMIQDGKLTKRHGSAQHHYEADKTRHGSARFPPAIFWHGSARFGVTWQSFARTLMLTFLIPSKTDSSNTDCMFFLRHDRPCSVSILQNSGSHTHKVHMYNRMRLSLCLLQKSLEVEKFFR